MKVIFLDIDGVLNSQVWFKKEYKKFKETGIYYNIHSVDDDALALLMPLLVENNVKLVISSTWRKNSCMDTVCAFEKYNTNISKLCDHIIGVTPKFPPMYKEDGSHATRGNEIKHFLDNTTYNITDYCIIDDDSDMLDEQLPYFVQTTTKYGLQKEHIERIKEILKLN